MVDIEGKRGDRLFHDGIERLCFLETCVLSLSFEFFNDPNPCEIHRSAVIVRAIEEIKAACGQDEPVTFNALPQRVQWLLSAYPSDSSIRIWEKENR